MEWVMMAFTFALGAFIGKLSVRFEAVINVVATSDRSDVEYHSPMPALWGAIHPSRPKKT